MVGGKLCIKRYILHQRLSKDRDCILNVRAVGQLAAASSLIIPIAGAAGSDLLIDCLFHRLKMTLGRAEGHSTGTPPEIIHMDSPVKMQTAVPNY